jgi:hypothetical protein
VQYDIRCFLRTIADGGDVSQVNRRGGLSADDDRADVGGVAQKSVFWNGREPDWTWRLAAWSAGVT